ncbi:MAG: DoxX family protein [Gemmatimonadota bacterium]
MEEQTSVAVSAASHWRRRIGWGLFVIVVALEALSLGEAGLSKFQSREGWEHWFGVFGYPPQMALLVGAVELVGAGLLFLPRLASYASIVVAMVMVGALHAVLTHETDLGWFDPILHMFFLTIIGAVQWKRRWRRA